MIRRPQGLTGDTKTFWDRHSARLQAAGLLTDADVESFALLCRTWATLNTVDTANDDKGIMKFIGLVKQYQSLAKQFSLLPRDRKKDNLDTSPQAPDEFGI